jgi:nucleoside phosphorylase
VTSTDEELRVLLGDRPFRILTVLAGATTPVSGRALGRSLGISPTTASTALARLKQAGFAVSDRAGRSNLWRLDRSNATIRRWLAEAATSTVREEERRPLQLSAVIFTALQLEYNAVVAHLPDRESVRVDTTRFEAGIFRGDAADWKVYVAEIGPGNTATGVEVASAAAALDPALVLFVGVAGSVKPDDLCRGDVIIADRVYNIHSGKDTWSDAEGSLHLPRPVSFPAAHGIVQLAMAVRRENWTTELAGIYPTAEALNINGKSPHAEIKAIAAGEVVHADNRSQLMEKVRRQLNDVGAVDMESFGLYEAAHVKNLPALAIRGISDSVGDKQPGTDANWQPRAASHAAGFAFALLRKAEPEDFGSRNAPSPEPSNSDQSPQEMLLRLPPPVALAYDWAFPIAGERARTVLNELVALGGQPATWLSRFRHRPPELFRGNGSAPLWVLVAEFADSHEHQTASWLYEEAAGRVEDEVLRAYLYSLGSVSASRERDSAKSTELLARAEAASPDGNPFWNYLRVALLPDAAAVLVATPPLVGALDLAVAVPALTAAAVPNSDKDRDSNLAAFVDEFAERHPALLEQMRLTVALGTAMALQEVGHLGAAQMLAERLTEGMPAYQAGQESKSALSALIGPRSSNVLLLLARILFTRAADRSNREMGFDRDSALARAEDLALTARDRRRDWGGPTGEVLAIAAQARAATGDIRGALRLLVPPPEGTAGAAEAGSQPVVRLAAQLAVGLGNIDRALELAARIEDPIERHLATALALTLRSDSHPEAVAEYRKVLAGTPTTARVDQQIRALLGLSMVTTLSDRELGLLDQLDAESADLIRAQAFLTAGRTSEAQILARQYESDAAIQIRVDCLVSQGRSADAIRALETHVDRRGGEHFLLQAAVIALSADITDEASRLASRVTSSSNAARRRAAHEILIDIAARQGKWEVILSETQRLLSDDEIAESDASRAASTIKYRWVQTHALHQLRRMDQAFEVVRAEPRLGPTNLDQARLVASILRTIAPSVTETGKPTTSEHGQVTQAEVLSAVTEAAQAFPDDEELVATAVMTAFSMPAAEPPDPGLMVKARALLQQFFDRFPDSRLIQTVPTGDELSGLKSFLHQHLAPRAQAVEDLRRRAWVGQIPISVCTSVINRSYAEALICNSIGCYVLRSPDERITAEEVEAARQSLDGTVVVDTSSLVLSAVVLGTVTHLRSHFERLLVTAPQRDDILATRAMLTTRAAGSLGWDLSSGRPTFVEYDAVITDRWAANAEELSAALERCDIVADPPYAGDPRSLMWTAPIRAAVERGVSLIADDAALRAAARSEGVAAFGSLQLLEALIGSGRLPSSAREDSYQRLMQVRAAELPLLDRLLGIARDEEWRPTGYAAFMLARPTTWTPPSSGWQKYMDLIRGLPHKKPDEIGGWCGSALSGLSLVAPPQTLPIAASALIAWTTLELRDAAVLPPLLAAAEQVVALFAPDTDLLRGVVYHFVATLREGTPPDVAARVILPLFAALEREAHTRALSYFFTMP